MRSLRKPFSRIYISVFSLVCIHVMIEFLLIFGEPNFVEVPKILEICSPRKRCPKVSSDALSQRLTHCRFTLFHDFTENNFYSYGFRLYISDFSWILIEFSVMNLISPFLQTLGITSFHRDHGYNTNIFVT